MWWTFAQYPEIRIHEAFFGFSRAIDIADMERAAALIHAPGINLMYGDDEGNIPGGPVPASHSPRPLTPRPPSTAPTPPMRFRAGTPSP